MVIRHFPLHPDTPRDGMTLEELFAGRDIDIPAAQTRLARLMSEEGLPCGERTMTYNSRLAQELATWAEAQPGGARIHDVLFRAYFVDNVNLALVDNLVLIAEQLGLPAAEARAVLDGRLQRAAVDADWRRSRELAVTAVPTFLIGNRRLCGAQPYEQLAAFAVAGGAPRIP